MKPITYSIRKKHPYIQHYRDIGNCSQFVDIVHHFYIDENQMDYKQAVSE